MRFPFMRYFVNSIIFRVSHRQLFVFEVYEVLVFVFEVDFEK